MQPPTPFHVAKGGRGRRHGCQRRACLAVPLATMRSPMIGGDANTIWLTHALMVYGGHHDLFTDLRNVAYQFSNPDYPPLVPP